MSLKPDNSLDSISGDDPLSSGSIQPQQASSHQDCLSSPKLSVVIPIFNESPILPELLARLKQTLDCQPGGPHEMVFVDDGSTDGTLDQLEIASQQDERIVVVSLSRNFGHQAALSAAFDFATGDVVIAMDADLQDPPEAIPQFLALYQQGFDVVYAIRVKRKEAWFKRLCYATFYWLVDRLSPVSLPRGAGDFGLMSRRVVDLVRMSPERHRYLRGLRTWYGFRQVGVEVERAARHGGEPKFSLRKLFQLAFDGIFAFSIIPIRVATLVGSIVVACALAFAAYALFAKLFFEESTRRSPQGFTALLFAITFLGGMQLLFLGVVGEYIGRIYDEVKRRPHYVVKKIVRRT